MGKIIMGDSKYGKVVAVYDGDKLIQGDSRYGKVIARVDGDKIIQGDSKYGKGKIVGDNLWKYVTTRFYISRYRSCVTM